MKPPSKVEGKPVAGRDASSGDIADFIGKVNALGRSSAQAAGRAGRLVFALDATMSRQPTWDLACALQGEMFKALGETQRRLWVQLVYFRGLGECRASRWVEDANALARLMSGISVRGGHTQIGKVFAHARAEHAKQKVDALVFVGDAMEEEVDTLVQKAGELGLLGCPIFVFQEGRRTNAEAAFREFARVSKGAFARFDASAPAELAALLKAVAVYASGGRDALRLEATPGAQALLKQLPPR